MLHTRAACAQPRHEVAAEPYMGLDLRTRDLKTDKKDGENYPAFRHIFSYRFVSKRRVRRLIAMIIRFADPESYVR